MSDRHCSIDDDETVLMLVSVWTLIIQIRTIFSWIVAHNEIKEETNTLWSVARGREKERKRDERKTNVNEEARERLKNHLTVFFGELWLTPRGGVSHLFLRILNEYFTLELRG